MPARTIMRPKVNTGHSPVAPAEICAVCECGMSAVPTCKIFARRYVNADGEVVGRLDCPFGPSLETIEVTAEAIKHGSGTPFRVRRVARARVREEWEDFAPGVLE